MKLVATVYGDDQPEKSTTEMEALLSNYPNLKGVIAPTTVGIAAAAQVVQSRGIASTGARHRPRPAERNARLRQGRHRHRLPALVAVQ